MRGMIYGAYRMPPMSSQILSVAICQALSAPPSPLAHRAERGQQAVAAYRSIPYRAKIGRECAGDAPPHGASPSTRLVRITILLRLF